MYLYSDRVGVMQAQGKLARITWHGYTRYLPNGSEIKIFWPDQDTETVKPSKLEIIDATHFYVNHRCFHQDEFAECADKMVIEFLFQDDKDTAELADKFMSFYEPGKYVPEANEMFLKDIETVAQMPFGPMHDIKNLKYQISASFFEMFETFISVEYISTYKGRDVMGHILENKDKYFSLGK